MRKDSGFILLNSFTVASSYRKHPPPPPPGTAWDIYLKEESLSRARGDNLAEQQFLSSEVPGCHRKKMGKGEGAGAKRRGRSSWKCSEFYQRNQLKFQKWGAYRGIPLRWEI